MTSSTALPPATLIGLNASQLAHLLQTRQLTAERLLTVCLERVAECEPQVKAWRHIDPAFAMEQARMLDSGPLRGPLHGLPLGVKDLFDTRDFPTGYGSPIYADHRPNHDAAAVALCRNAGAIVLGKTVTTEFATFSPGPTSNPHNVLHTPGGSSSGSAAAVGAQMIPLALGTQTAASIIRPAAYCGVVGFKPSFGLISRAGVKSLSESLDTVGGFGRCVADVALLTSVMAGAPEWRLPTGAGKPRIGVCRTAHWDQASPAMQHTLMTTVQRLSAAGVPVSDVELPDSFGGLAGVHDEVMCSEAFKALADERLNHPEGLSERLLEMLERGAGFGLKQTLAHRAALASARHQMGRLFAGFDLLLTPSACGEAERGLERTGDPVFSRAWSLLGLPSLNLPVGFGPQGLPLGVQLTGPIFSDTATLGFCQEIEALLQQ
ncbi:amidase [Pseudomonas huanghezhanensis]|uniref:amidase n=1 Tax=Pseudomonas huanghezhanensis TaxID=3002903 RepID=UPI0022858337|nr:amidase [Pseudomonas sp. BSw22131]